MKFDFIKYIKEKFDYLFDETNFFVYFFIGSCVAFLVLSQSYGHIAVLIILVGFLKIVVLP